jgi:hypothetical protein
VCKRKPSDVADILIGEGLVADGLRMPWDKRSSKRMKRASRGPASTSDRGPIDDSRLAQCLDGRSCRTEARRLAMAGQQ